MFMKLESLEIVLLGLQIQNQKCEVAVKTPWGSLTDRVCLNRIKMQGTNPAPLKCSVQVDTLGMECSSEGEGLFKYKECTNIPALTFVDDTLAFTTWY